MSSYRYINFFCGAFNMKELEAIKARVKEMEEEAEKLKEMQKQVEESIMSPTAGQPTCKNFVMPALKRTRLTASAWRKANWCINCVLMRVMERRERDNS